jgi:hypothetical protein
MDKPCVSCKHYWGCDVRPLPKGVECGVWEVGRKDDAEQPRWSLLPWEPVEEVVRVLGFRAKKYGDSNWQSVEKPQERYFSAAVRHLGAWHLGEPKDSESGFSHLAHAVCCLLFLMWFDRKKRI